MFKMLKLIGFAGLLSLTAGAVSAQDFNVRIGVGNDRPDRIERRDYRDRDHFDRRDRVERHVIRTESRPRIVVRSKPQYRTVCRTVTKVTRVGNVSIRRPTQECTRRLVSSSNRIVIRR
jgi:hypothetical protein